MPHPFHVLIVDDQFSDLLLLEDILDESPLDILVTTALSGELALARLTEPDAPDLILLDYHLPGMTGLDVLGAVRERSQLDGIPVVVRSGSTDPRDAAAALAAGAQEYLTKPFGYAEQREQLLNILNRWQTDG
ncbi:response regulator [Deinococcus soli (ex Cha et al. 2016)]|jgi:putative two-component system response regulator|uniref:CheY-like chemotaxis protein n=2 Tax=Deinococcus soli (ex Cha et al. 2016) TaxID=1309411 RepID=A0AAE4BM41_9DEIO|nr:response regulator [Deinococcus soli (ex Cha et al. 2016)]MDR6218107.1 CheY-like chemotaxis protein [Deinococcus soli (ex Cha et al. 2016)]MDR6328357.1 CheY-like chemotaxis protein [Deinococcus soli (ex Cha et al. 2016)]MDR6751209.1 CheY-like chemotaxis protein [Deinococcus soli (ex Cha et al. 2016)]